MDLFGIYLVGILNMRQVDPKVLEERKNKILQAVIHRYIKTAKPVASNVLCEGDDFDLSPATIRSLMSELENDGFLTHPHTSAGRIPTDKGYRQYVDSLIELQRLAIEEEVRVRHEYDSRIREIEDLLTQTSHVLSSLSNFSGFVLTPKTERNKLQHLELLRVSENKVLIVMVTETGMVRHKIIEAGISIEKLSEMSRLLNQRLRGLSLNEARQRVVQEIEDIEREEKDVFSLFKKMSREMFDFDEEVYIDGTNNVLTLPEFHDYEPMRNILRLSEDRGILMHLLEKDIDREGVQVMIGSESSCKELKNLSVVSSVYKNGTSPVGVLGIIGPKRMEYPKMMAIVNAVSKCLNKLLAKNT